MLPNVNMILTAKVNQGTGKKHFLVEVEDGEVESTDADDGSEENVASKSSRADYGDSPKRIFKSVYVPVRTFIHSHEWNALSG